MSKQKERNSDEYYRGIIRSLKSEIRNLKKQIKKLERIEYNNFKGDREPREEMVQVEPDCPSCGKGLLEVNTVVGRKFKVCPICQYRSPAIKV